MISVTHIITALETGGAEMMLYKLLSRTDRSVFASRVVSLTTVGPIGERIRALGVPVDALGINRRVPTPLALLRLARQLRHQRPNVVQTWMYHADLLGGVAAAMIGAVPVVWCVQNGTLHPRLSRRTTIWTAHACAAVSHWLPSRIVAVAEASRRVHEALGYSARKFVIIPNAIDTEAFRPDRAARSALRAELSIPEASPAIGMVARFDPQKDHETFVRAAALLHRCHPQAHFVLCGDGVDWDNPRLRTWVEASGSRSRFRLLGRRSDVVRICAALDIAALSSAYGEALPNAIAEAMACGVPCVVTDVGDSRALVADTGRTVPPSDPGALADAWRELLDASAEERARLGRAARGRVEREFALSGAVARYERLYRELAAAPRG